jgi:nucleoside-diphosphate-sugar epimerase
MKLLLVGGAGHVGQLITPYLKARHRLRVLDLAPPADPDVEHVRGSVLDPEAIRQALQGVDGFVWLAMRSAQGGMVTDQDIETIVNNYDLNTKALHLFLYLAQEAGVKRGVYTSSMSVHYRVARTTPARTRCRSTRPPSMASARAWAKRSAPISRTGSA